MKIKSSNLFHDILQWIWEVYLENDKNQYRTIEIIALFVTPGMRSGGARHVIYAYIPTLSLIYLSFLRVEFAALYILSFSITCPQNFKHYYNHGNHLVFKYIFNYVGIGPLVLEHKIHQQRLCTLSKKVVIWHPFTVLFMIFNFKNDLLFIKMLNVLKQIACEKNKSIFVI